MYLFIKLSNIQVFIIQTILYKTKYFMTSFFNVYFEICDVSLKKSGVHAKYFQMRAFEIFGMAL